MKVSLELFVIIAVHVVLWTTCSNPVFADCETTKLLASDRDRLDKFGSSVAICDDTVILGAYNNDDKGSDSGSAYIFRFNGSQWLQEAKLLPSDDYADMNWFGYSIDMSGDTAVIGACLDDVKGIASGSAYIFRYNGSEWIQQAKLVASDGVTSAMFGCSVAISGDTVIVGAMLDGNGLGTGPGSAYIFRFNGSTWVQECKLLASDGEATDRFGCSVSISGDTALLGADGDDDNGIDSGAAYFFRFNGTNWVQTEKILALDAESDARFGVSVDLSADAAVIGADASRDVNSDVDSAYIFRFDRSKWAQEAKLSNDHIGDHFGHSVSILDDTVIIGTNWNMGVGSSYIFRFNGSEWVQEAELLATDGEVGDCFGQAVAISGDTAVVGALTDDNSSGSVYIYGLSDYPGDLDLDNDVDYVDFYLFASFWMESNCGPCNCDRADITRNGRVDIHDLEILANNWIIDK